MQDTDTRQLFNRLVEDEPPLPDIAPYVDAAHAAGRGRRLAYTGASALAVAAAVGAAIAVPSLLAGGPAGSGQIATAGPAAQASAAAKLPEWVPAYPPTTESPAQAVARLTAALKSELKLPVGARLVATSSFVPSRSDLPPLEFYPSQGGYKTTADVTDPAGTSNIFIDVFDASTTPLTQGSCQQLAADHTCTTYRTRAGDRVIVTRQVEASGVIRLSVTTARLDGGGVYVTCQNYGENSVPQVKNAPAPTPQRPTPICTQEQLVAVALAPALSYHPPGTAPLRPMPFPVIGSPITCTPGATAPECPPAPSPRR